MAFSGAWRTQARAIDTALKPGQISPTDHQVDDGAAGSRPPAVKARVDYAPSIVDVNPERPLRTRGDVKDVTPLSHDFGTVGGGYRDSVPSRARREANAARQRDLGSVRRVVERPVTARAADEVRSTTHLEVLPISQGSRLSSLRGANSLPENNPEPPRNGVRVMRFLERRMTRRQLIHDERPIRVHTAASPHESPPLTGTGRYGSPYGLTANARVLTQQSPMQRRSPGPWDADLATDGITDSASYLTWGL